MAHAYFTSVWLNSRQRLGALLVMLVLGDYADEHGRSYPSLAKIAKLSRMTTRQVRRIIRKLEKEGEIEIERRGGQFNGHNYAHNFRILFAPVIHRGADKLSSREDNSSKKGGKNVLLSVRDPSLNTREVNSRGAGQARPSYFSRISQAALERMIANTRAEIREITNPVGRAYATLPSDPAQRRRLEQLQDKLDAMRAEDKRRSAAA